MKKIFLPSAFIIFAFVQFSFAANNYQTQINNAEESFKNGKFEAAAAVYESLINVEKINDPKLYYNLSNAYYKNGNLGKAVLNIEKAYRLAPRDADIKSNRIYLSSLAGDKDDSLKDFFTGTFSLNELSAFCAFLIILIFSLASVSALKKRNGANKIIFVAVIFFIPSLFWTCYKVKIEIINNEAAVLKNLTARSGPGENNPEIFELKEGKIVEIISENAAWSNISLVSAGEKLTGWAEAKNIKSINNK